VDRIFLLSPANTSGERANLLYNPKAGFDLAQRLQTGEAIPLGEIFSFISGLYFRGKLSYANSFARPPLAVPGAHVITSNRGLIPVDLPTSIRELRAFARTPIDPSEPDYLNPLRRAAKRLRKVIGPSCELVLLGSIGTKKYAEALLEQFGDRLLFPPSFVGRGDMSRGGLLLRAVAESRELEYVPLAGAIRHGKRPAKLEPKCWGYKILEGKTPLKKAAA
jgi:hypothetical protein